MLNRSLTVSTVVIALLGASGFGTPLRRGMFVGRIEVVRERDVDYNVRWRVARITPSRLRRAPDGQLSEAPAEVVFERDDATHHAPPAEHSLTLAPADPPRGRGSFRLANAAGAVNPTARP